jgi:hypothetical protein
MAEATIGHLIEEMRTSTQAQITFASEDTKEVVNSIDSLTDVFTDYFKILKGQEGDKLEKEREEKKPKAAPAELPNFGSMVKDAGGFGFLGIVGAIGAALAGLAAGFLDGVRDSFKLLTPKFITKLFKTKVFQPVIRFFDAFGDIFRKAGTGQILKGDTFKVFGRFTTTMQDIATGISKFIKPLVTAKDAVFNGFARMGNFFSSLKRQFKLFFLASGVIRSQISNLKSIFTIFGSTAQTGGKIFQGLFSVIKPFFGVFARLGKFLGGPITIAIFGIIDSFMGAFEGFKEEGFLGGILGAIGGLARGLIGMPLDLIKSAISWIAGKLGFENFSNMLDSFSFSDMIFGMFMKVANIGNEIISSLFGGFEDGFGAGMKQMLKTLMIYIKRMLLFPVAIMAGGVAALAAALPGGKSPLEAFTDTFSKTIRLGEGSGATTLPSEQTSGGGDDEDATPQAKRKKVNRLEFNKERVAQLERMSQKGDLSSRQADELERRRKDVERMEKQQTGGGMTAVNAPTTNNTTTNNNTTASGSSSATDRKAPEG